MNSHLIDSTLTSFLKKNGVYEAFLGNVTNFSFTLHNTAELQMSQAFIYSSAAEGEEFWKTLYLKLCGERI